MFKVVADQLKISQGWVRCGHCSEVFDATAHLQPFDSPDVVDPSAINNVDMSQVVDAPAPAPVPDSAHAAAAEVLAPPISMPEIQVSLPPDLAADVFVSSANPEPPDLPPPEPASPASASRSDFVESEVPEHDSTHDVSFVRDARRNAFWRRPGMRGALSLVAFVLLVVLLVQIAQFQRNTLAAWQPWMGQGLQAMCVQLRCEIEPAKQIESVLIDSSSFNKIAADAYRLKVVIKNAGAIALAMPSLELTLTDTQDQALLRRVLAPVEMGATDAVLAAGAEFSGVVAIKISNPLASGSPAPASASRPSGALRIAGYRVLAFYP